MKLNPLFIGESNINYGGLSFHHDKCPLTDHCYCRIRGLYTTKENASDSALSEWTIHFDEGEGDTNTNYTAYIQLMADIEDKKHSTSAKISASDIILHSDRFSVQGLTNIDATSGYAAIHYGISEKLLRVRFGIGTINKQYESFSVEVYETHDTSNYKARLDLWADSDNKPHLRIYGPNGVNSVNLA